MKINQIRPLEHVFTEVLENIALKAKMLYYYGKLPGNVGNSGFEGTESSTASAAEGAPPGDNPPASAIESAPPGDQTHPKRVAIVGARCHTAYGREIAYRAAYDLAKEGIVIISGLAYGIDSVAHRGALDAGGVTVAVLGTPIDQIYPRDHEGLAREIIAKGGAVMSEYAPRDPEILKELAEEAVSGVSEGPGQLELPGLEPDGLPLAPGEYINNAGKRNIKHSISFLYRNRLIAGLADAVLVAEAAEHSGSLNTAVHTLEQGKDLFTPPADITRPLSAGCNKLLMQGALIYTKPQDILERLCPEKTRRKHRTPCFPGSPLEKQIAQEIFRGTRDGDQIIDALGISAREFNQAITMLELRDIVKPLGMNQWMVT